MSSLVAIWTSTDAEGSPQEVITGRRSGHFHHGLLRAWAASQIAELRKHLNAVEAATSEDDDGGGLIDAAEDLRHVASADRRCTGPATNVTTHDYRTLEPICDRKELMHRAGSLNLAAAGAGYSAN